MKPLHVMQVLEATAGGTRRHLRDLVLALRQRRYQVTVVAALARDPDFQRDLDLFRLVGIAVELLPMRRRIAPLGDWRAVARLTSLIRRLRPDIVHAHSSKAGMVARLAARRAGCLPVIYTPHAFAFLSDHPLRRLYRICERWAAPYTAHLIAVSREEEAWACDTRCGVALPAARVHYIPNGIVREALPQITTQTVLTVGFVGRLCRQKGPDFFLAAASRLRTAHSAIRFCIVGDGPWHSWVSRRANSFDFAGTIHLDATADDSGASALMRGFDVLAIPSRWEGLPYTLLEGMTAGAPVVAMAAGGIADVLHDGVSGLLCAVGDVVGLTARICALLEDKDLRQRLRWNAWQRVGDFTLPGMVEATCAIYERSGRR